MAADSTYPSGFHVRSDGTAHVPSGSSLDVESGGALKIAGTSLTPTAAEFNILYGVTATAAEINKLAGVTGGTATASKAVVLDSSKIISGMRFPAVARTATADGLTTAIIADAGGLQFVTVTSSNADHIIVLPTPTPGTIVILANGGTGYELRSSAPATVAINGGAASNGESAIAANTMVIAVCTSATTWQAIGLAGTTLAAVEAAA